MSWWYIYHPSVSLDGIYISSQYILTLPRGCIKLCDVPLRDIAPYLSSLLPKNTLRDVNTLLGGNKSTTNLSMWNSLRLVKMSNEFNKQNPSQLST